MDRISRAFTQEVFDGKVKVEAISLIVHNHNKNASRPRGNSLQHGRDGRNRRRREDAASDGGGQHAVADVAGGHRLVAAAAAADDGHARGLGVGGQRRAQGDVMGSGGVEQGDARRVQAEAGHEVGDDVGGGIDKALGHSFYLKKME